MLHYSNENSIMNNFSYVDAIRKAAEQSYINKQNDHQIHKFDRFMVDKSAILTTLHCSLKSYLRGFLQVVTAYDKEPHVGSGAICIGISDSSKHTFMPITDGQIIIRYIHSAGGPSIRVSQMGMRGESTLGYIQIPFATLSESDDDEIALSVFDAFIMQAAKEIMDSHARMEIRELSSPIRKLRIKKQAEMEQVPKEEIVIQSFLYSDYKGVIYNPYE